ncbi:16S rRNA (guanine(527)-N(7))-methyltransferase RsmG [Synechococcus sp. HB1133]|jgi:16S rRNA (guanine527-N7)-methyltransferase|uniref:16S rRNA (guanine(527)-N(7))-methyltransferase RsmG n=1 Tax=unclassified Synechococcus TaxID=2626047 RepID=UPI0014091C41|nr:MULTISPECIES: 16S rRNA (guanine(527)-N(7))-methyltransferase RsmG [unclassified Synechococcus]MCB4394199.1 16S rRNA (guanine(527)-N(7))-methyltransferase RsmG [Synechococcus sp. PH41509]MCB4423408.1 16S rRNA (guanine(527)-N(7))-methyltransferase RsmG [Synechococcus sp. HB1133]MCB4431481.1 16S rRNA (guanine(527)-N(7))-methyltransferase RsmG [Synechococcus sp. HBA1120]NHI82356.1 16S rRNA (guanine(527)-N(7))-methyltransferase RsmG [Synechococcus sp. HB1133]
MAATAPEPAYWDALGWQPSQAQRDQLVALQGQLQSWNQKVNLTRLVDGDDFWVGQVFDSLWPLTGELQSPEQPLHWIDVGTGGGFPGLAIAIALPKARVTLLDSVGRKTAAVEAMANTLGLADRVRVRTERIETTGRDGAFRGSFDRAVARAVAAAPVVAEYLVPLLNTDGQALLYRGQWNDTDAVPFNKALRLLQARLVEVQHRQLPNDRGTRHLLRVQPNGPCPRSYPRAVGTPSREPLGT